MNGDVPCLLQGLRSFCGSVLSCARLERTRIYPDAGGGEQGEEELVIRR